MNKISDKTPLINKPPNYFSLNHFESLGKNTSDKKNQRKGTGMGAEFLKGLRKKLDKKNT